MHCFTVYKGSHDGSVRKAVTNKPEPSDDQVLVRITASGLCGTDVHYRTQDLVLGHEGVGVVEATGPAVRQLKKGDRVGWGYEHDSCGLCEFCHTGRETFCPDRRLYGYADLDQGSFASGAIWRESFLFKIPETLSDTDAAPLMCAGATVFNALHTYGTAPTARVGIIGIGGLGHLAIQFASKMGCDVTVFSSTESKREEAIELGAKTFYATKGKKELDIGKKKLDLLLVTTNSPPDWDLYLPLMSPNSVIFPLSIALGNFAIPYQSLVSLGLRIQGSIVAPRAVQRQMLDFAARNGIKPIVRKFPMTEEGISDAFKTLEEGRMRYRAVLVPGRSPE